MSPVIVWSPALCPSALSPSEQPDLVEDALKYSFEAGRVEGGCQPEQDAYAVSVADSGPGIARELQPFLFERYFRAPTVEGRVPGHGLGLLLVHRVVRAHQGQVSVTSTGRPGECSCASQSCGRTLARPQDCGPISPTGT